MKRFLVPTDFSENAARAADFAVVLANAFLGEITLLHVFPPGISQRLNHHLAQDAEREMDRELDRLRQLLREGTALSGLVLMAETIVGILDQAERRRSDLIVMGTQGQNAIENFLAGNITTSVMARARRPILAVPNSSHLKAPDEIVLAIDNYGISAPKILRPLRELTRVFASKVRIYHQVREHQTAIPDLLVDSALDGINHSFHEEVSEEEVWDGILRFAKETNAGMLCLIHRDRGWLERLFFPSVTTQELAICPIPMLIVPDDRSFTG